MEQILLDERTHYGRRLIQGAKKLSRVRLVGLGYDDVTVLINEVAIDEVAAAVESVNDLLGDDPHELTSKRLHGHLKAHDTRGRLFARVTGENTRWYRHGGVYVFALGVEGTADRRYWTKTKIIF